MRELYGCEKNLRFWKDEHRWTQQKQQQPEPQKDWKNKRKARWNCDMKNAVPRICLRFFSSLHSVWPCYSRKTSHKFKHQFLLHLQSTLHILYVHLCWVLFWHTQKKRFVKPFFSYYFKFELLIEEFSELNFMVHSKQNDGSEKKIVVLPGFFCMQEKSIFRLMHSTGINFFVLKCISMLFRQIVGLHLFSPQGMNIQCTSFDSLNFMLRCKELASFSIRFLFSRLPISCTQTCFLCESLTKLEAPSKGNEHTMHACSNIVAIGKMCRLHVRVMQKKEWYKPAKVYRKKEEKTTTRSN